MAASPDARAGRDRTFPGLDVLRGWAAISVVLLHACALLGISLFKSGYIAVDVFFLMSGFVIAHAYDHRIPALGVVGFMRVRAIRFYPLLALGLAIGVVRSVVLMRASHAPFGAPQVLEALIFNMLFLPAPPFVLSSTEISPLDGPAWSLMLEMAINLAYVLMFRWLTTRVLVMLIAAALAGLTLSVFVFHSLVLGPLWPTLAGGLARVSFSFPLGVLLYRLDLPPVRLGFLVLPGLLAITCLGGSPWFDLALVVFAAPALVLIAAHSTPKWAALSAWLAAISYALYAIHAPLLMMADGLSHRLDVAPAGPILAVIAGLLVACPLLDRWYDRPVRRWLSRLGRPRPAVVVPGG